MHLTVKISCTLFLLVIIQFADSFPQFSIPFVRVSWNKNMEAPPKFLNVPNPFLSPFAQNRPAGKTHGNNEVVNKNEKIIPVTPNAGFHKNSFDKQTVRTEVIQTTQDPRVWGVNVTEKIEENNNLKKDKQNLENKIIFKENDDKYVNKIYLDDNDVNSISTEDDFTTESTTEYESTTFDDLSGLNRSGVSGHVVASLLG